MLVTTKFSFIFVKQTIKKLHLTYYYNNTLKLIYKHLYYIYQNGECTLHIERKMEKE